MAYFSMESICQYILDQGGKVEYHKLIKNFRSALADPSNQEARIKFKDYVNTVAYVSQEANTKYLNIRPEFLQPLTNKCKAKENITLGSDYESREYGPYNGRYAYSDEQSSNNQRRDYYDHNIKVFSNKHYNQVYLSLGDQRLDFSPSMVSNSNLRRVIRNQDESLLLSPADNLHTVTSYDVINRSSESQNISGRNITSPFYSNIQTSKSSSHQLSENICNSESIENGQSSRNSNSNDSKIIAIDKVDSTLATRRSSFNSFNSWFDNQSSAPPQPPPRRKSLTSSNSSLINCNSLEQKMRSPIASNIDIKDEIKPIDQAEKLKEIHELAIKAPGRVKEHAQKLNKIVSESELKVPMPVNNNHTRKTKDAKDEDDLSSGSPFDPLKKNWMITASNCDYNQLVSLLKEDPNLAGFKTALHWAAKFGKPDIINLIAGSYEVNVNIKSGGYTALHLAAMHNKIDIMELLINVYGANKEIRDHSGRLAHDYLPKNDQNQNGDILRNKYNNSISSGYTQKHHSSSSSHSKTQEKYRSEFTSTFIRIGSLNNRVRKTAAAITGIKSWGSAESVSDSNMPQPKQSLSKKKRNKKALSTPPLDKIIARDSDSDSAYGFAN